MVHVNVVMTFDNVESDSVLEVMLEGFDGFVDDLTFASGDDFDGRFDGF